MAPELIDLEQRIRARPETIFAFLTDPTRYVQWQGVAAELDPAPGGLYRVTMVDGSIAEGRYVAVEPPHRLVFTWGWRGNDELPPGASTVEITLTEDDDVTILRLRHLDLPSLESRDIHDQGWRMFLGELAVVSAESAVAHD